jgi:hypothetical protein
VVQADYDTAESERARVDQSREESGEFCLINEMQVLVSNGRAHV